MNNNVESIEYKSYIINIYADDFPLDPIEDFDWLGTLVCWHSRYNIGHKPTYKDCSPDEYLKYLAEEADNTIDNKINYWEYENGWKCLINKYPDSAVGHSDERIKDIVNKAINKYYIMLNIYMYDHSGITIRTSPFSCLWDSGQIGFIYVSKEKIRKEYNWKSLTKERIKTIEDYLRNEVKTYDQYLRGEVYGYYIVDPITEENLDSCSGFYGDWEENELLSQAKGTIDYEIEEQEAFKNEMYNEEMGDMSQF